MHELLIFVVGVGVGVGGVIFCTVRINRITQYEREQSQRALNREIDKNRYLNAKLVDCDIRADETRQYIAEQQAYQRGYQEGLNSILQLGDVVYK